MNSICNKAILGSVIAFFAYQTSVFSQNSGVVFPKINGSTSEMDSSEVLEVAGGVKILGLKGKGERNVVVGPDGRLRERPIPTKPANPGGGGLWKPEGSNSLTTDRSVAINGDISADTANFNVVEVLKLISADTTNIITFGDNTLFLDLFWNRLFADFSNTFFFGITIGNTRLTELTGNTIVDYLIQVLQIAGQTALAKNSTAIGYNVGIDIDADYAMVLGSGVNSEPIVGNQTDPLRNLTPNSLMIGFNSDIPTLYVGPSSGPGTTGKVSIGNDTISSGPHTDWKFSVDGKAVAKKFITTQVNWADDELKKELTLEDLKKEEEYVDANSHLEGIPSGKIIEQDGLDLSEMSSMQMRKIEQVFMYLFKFRNVINELKAIIFKLKKENKAFKKDNRELRDDYSDLLKRVEALEEEVE